MYIAVSDEPFDATLQCMSSFAENVVAGQPGSGSVMILTAFIDNVRRFYCAVCSHSVSLTMFAES